MTKFATTALVTIALAGATSTATAGGLTAPIVDAEPVAPVVAAGGLNTTAALVAAGLIGVGAIALAVADDDDDDSTTTTTTTTTTTE